MLSFLGVVLIGMGVVGLADLGPLRASRPRGRGGVLRDARPAAAIWAGLGLIVVDLLLSVVVFLVLGGTAGAQETGADLELVEIMVTPSDDDDAPLFIDALGSTVVLRVQAREFPANRTGTIRQCVDFGSRRCLSPQPIRFDERGRADVQFLVRQQLGRDGDRCGVAGARCVVEVVARDDLAEIELFFGQAAPEPGRLEVSPRDGLVLGGEVAVRASGFAPGVDLVVTVCAAPAVRGDRCGSPAPEVSMVTNPDGRAEASYVLDIGQVGSDRVACGRRTPCQMVVLSNDALIRAPAVRLSVASTPGPSYEAARLIVGLVVAAGLLAAGLVLIRATDWSPPSEADSSAIDEAAFADLDAEARAHDELESLSG